MLYQLSYEASLEAGQVRVQFIPVIGREWHDVYMILHGTLRYMVCMFTSQSYDEYLYYVNFNFGALRVTRTSS